MRRIFGNGMIGRNKQEVENGLFRKLIVVYFRRLHFRSELVSGRILWCITIIGIPVGLQCFKFASLSFFPFGKEVSYGGGAGSLILNIIWLVVSGLPLALEHLVFGMVLCITVIGIPFGLQQFKLAKLALMPFGAEIV